MGAEAVVAWFFVAIFQGVDVAGAGAAAAVGGAPHWLGLGTGAGGSAGAKRGPDWNGFWDVVGAGGPNKDLVC